MGWAGALAPMLLASWRTCCPCSRSRRPRAVAVARPLLRPLPPSRSPCRHVAVAPLRLRRHCAFAGDHHAYALCAVLRCLSGMSVAPGFAALSAELSESSLLSWGVVAVRTRLVVARASLAANGRLRAPALSAAWALSATFPPGGLNKANTPIPRLPGPTWPLLIHREHGDPGPQQPLLRGVPWVVCRRLP